MTLPPRTYSDRLGVIDGNQLQQACDRFDLGTLEAAEPASAGLWGQNILLTTTRGRFVFRGDPLPDHQLAKERTVAAALHAGSGLAAPWPYNTCDEPDLFGWSYAVMPMLPGTMGAALWERADDDSKIVLAAAHGAALAAMHEATFPTSGPYDPATDAFTPVDDVAAWTLARIDSLRLRCRDIRSLHADDERFIDELLDSCSTALQEPCTAVVVHHDFSLANTNYETHGDAYQPTGVFDLGEAHLGDGEEDLVRFLFRRRRAQRDSFVRAYTDRHPLRPGASARLALYALADLLFMWDVSKRITGWFGDDSFVVTATPVIAAARGAAQER